MDGRVFAELLGTPVVAVEHVELARCIATPGTVGGALGAGSEDDDVVRAAAYTRSKP